MSLGGLPAEPEPPLFDCCSGNGDSCPPAVEVDPVLGLPPPELPGLAGGVEDGGDAGGCGSEGIELSDMPVHAASPTEASTQRLGRTRR